MDVKGKVRVRYLPPWHYTGECYIVEKLERGSCEWKRVGKYTFHRSAEDPPDVESADYLHLAFFVKLAELQDAGYLVDLTTIKR